MKTLLTIVCSCFISVSVCSADLATNQTDHANSIVSLQMLSSDLAKDYPENYVIQEYIAHEIDRHCIQMGFEFNNFICKIAVRNWNTIL